MKYTLLIYLSPEDFSARTDPARKDAFWGSFIPYLKTLHESGVAVGSVGLEPPEAATTVMIRDGQRLVQDGPFPDTKEQLGGLFTIEVPDFETACDWAARCPVGTVEVRRNLLQTG
jgi:hypothetical protein